VATTEDVPEMLIDAGLRESAVERLADEYAKMRRRFQQEEYEEVGAHVGRFCEAVVHVLSIELGETLDDEVQVSQFAHDLRKDIGTGEPDSVQYILSEALLMAYKIRSHRDTVHLDLQKPVSRSDTRVGIATCSWIFAELIHVYGDADDDSRREKVGSVISDISEPTDGQPLRRLEVSKYEFDEEKVADALSGYVRFVREDEDVQPDSDFSGLGRKSQIVSLLLGKLSGYKIGYYSSIGAKKNWIGKRYGYKQSKVTDNASKLDFVFRDTSENGYHIPGYRVDEAVDYL
jgi:hypothetical protein